MQYEHREWLAWEDLTFKKPWNHQPIPIRNFPLGIEEEIDWKKAGETFLVVYTMCLTLAFFAFVVYLQFGNLINPTH
jgi:hypothetical protein